jgi:hypothetical protein
MFLYTTPNSTYVNIMPSDQTVKDHHTPTPPHASSVHEFGINSAPRVPVDDWEQIRACYQAGHPFVIEGATVQDQQLSIDDLRERIADEEVTCFNPEYLSDKMTMGELLNRVEQGEKYRIRADVQLGKLFSQHFNTSFFEKVRGVKITLMDMLLHFLAKKSWAVFLSTPGCKMSNHSHINSTFVVQLEGTKTWHMDFRYLNQLEHPTLYPYDYLAKKHPVQELVVHMKPGNILYVPAYWLHYTDTDTVSLSMHYLFTEKMSYYFSKRMRKLFFFEMIRRPIGMLKLALARDNEFAFGDKSLWSKRCTEKELTFLAENDYS